MPDLDTRGIRLCARAHAGKDLDGARASGKLRGKDDDATEKVPHLDVVFVAVCEEVDLWGAGTRFATAAVHCGMKGKNILLW